ncbi:DegT/DnrJ/EryC1/StrS family aminotransferase [Rhodobium gokarnense]|uniref:dTDP-4-amino-4,6-dideoxygalactose transaminase n=1 Tax=Rhodobium gokarnense TaxID=364296 RepID=A0ABT3HE02_9HYPH|nr:DegT/DnrJ/EryC1/StrS family aminotransferase [Rhodobium gokarnense]MCW2308635.1 dTDP-4-amino-4,6-dideoxygalactose transaminase [Rhodobium gokarnense]
MKATISDFQVFGGSPTFDVDRVVGQVYMPDREVFDTWFSAISERAFYTNHGPLVARLDAVIADRLEVANAVSVTNGTVALMVALTALELSGDVIVPAFTFPATVQAVVWAGLRPVFADVDPVTHNLTPETVAAAMTPETTCVLGVHVWGRPCEPAGLKAFCRQNALRLAFDACHGFGCSHDGRMLGNFGDVEVFSFHATKIVNGAEGGCITTNDDELAARLRTVANFHRSPADRDCKVRINAKMTEAQAAMALMALSEFEQYVDRNRAIYEVYREQLGPRSDVRMIAFDASELQNYQYAVFELGDEAGISRDDLLAVLRREGVHARRYFAPGVHKLHPFEEGRNGPPLPITDQLCDTLFQLPVGAFVTPQDARLIANLVSVILDNADAFSQRLATSKDGAASA